MKKTEKMKQRALTFSMLILFILGVGILSSAQVIKKSKQLTKSFPVNSNTEIEISNKYGNVNIITWEKDSVRFEIELEVKGSKQAKVDKTFNLIDFDFESTKYYTNAHTVFVGNSFWNDVTEKSSSFFGSKTTVKIVYNVYLPATTNLKVINKYGSIYMSDYSGKLTIDLSNGDLKANDLAGYSVINMEFGISTIQNINEAKMSVRYGSVYLEEGNSLNIVSKSSEFHFTEIGSLQLSSKRDKIFTISLGTLKGNSDFTRLEIETIDKAVDFKAKYGDIVIRGFGNAMGSFNLNTDDSNVVLRFADDKQYNLKIVATEDTKVYYSSSITNIKNKEIEGEKKLIQVDCVVGDNSKKIVPLKINAESGTLSLKRK
jgi:hypothetical protein